jgi:hypothetical protein
VSVQAAATVLLLIFYRTEKHGNSVSAHSRPGGSNGTNGSPGTRPSTYLTGGKTSILQRLFIHFA